MSRDEYLIGQAMKEGHERPDYFQHLQLPLPVLLAIVGHLQIALKVRPGPRGVSSRLVADAIVKIIERLREDGFRYNADYLEAGQAPRDTQGL